MHAVDFIIIAVVFVLGLLKWQGINALNRLALRRNAEGRRGWLTMGLGPRDVPDNWNADAASDKH